MVEDDIITPGQANVQFDCGCDYDTTLIASNSSCFRVTGNTNNNIYYGSATSGWNSTQWALNSFGQTITSINYQNANCAVPLPINIGPTDIITLCGIIICEFDLGSGILPDYSINLSQINCSDVLNTGTVLPVNTLITQQNQNLNSSGTACFSSSFLVNSIYNACETLLIVGIGLDTTLANPGFSYILKFSYTLNILRNCSEYTENTNMIIRLCCDPQIENIVTLPSTYTVGTIFVDFDDHCWEIIAETNLPVTEVRQIAATYNSCESCILAYPCQANFIATGCCDQPGEIYTSALPGVNVLDSFVDQYGFCWYLSGNTFEPTTSLVTVSTVYPANSCEDGACVAANPCPAIYVIKSCCEKYNFSGYTTLQLLGFDGFPVTPGTSFVDQFEICWLIMSSPVINVTANINFIRNASNTAFVDCENCVLDNACDSELIYKVKNCCTGAIEYVSLPTIYNVGNTINLVSQGGDLTLDCYTIISWSNIYIPTIVNINLNIESYVDCKKCITNNTPCNGSVARAFQNCCNPGDIQFAIVPPAQASVGSVSILFDATLPNPIKTCYTAITLVPLAPTLTFFSGSFANCTTCLKVAPCGE